MRLFRSQLPRLAAVMAILWLGGCGGKTAAPTTPAEPSPIVCTMDAKVCPDGSSVGRTGPYCEFICPGASAAQ